MNVKQLNQKFEEQEKEIEMARELFKLENHNQHLETIDNKTINHIDNYYYGFEGIRKYWGLSIIPDRYKITERVQRILRVQIEKLIELRALCDPEFNDQYLKYLGFVSALWELEGLNESLRGHLQNIGRMLRDDLNLSNKEFCNFDKIYNIPEITTRVKIALDSRVFELKQMFENKSKSFIPRCAELREKLVYLICNNIISIKTYDKYLSQVENI